MKKSLFTLLFVSCGLLISGVYAQEDMMEPMPRGEGSWYMMSHVQFEPGMMKDAMELVEKHFVPVDKALGNEVMAFFPISGDWDVVVYFEMPDGLEELEYYMSPSDVEWWEKFSEMAGGEEKAMEVWDEYLDMVEKQDRYLVWHPKSG